MKKFALKAAVIAIAGYLLLDISINMIKDSQKNYLLRVITLPNNRRLPKFCLIMAASIVIPQMLICLSTLTFPSQILS